MINEEKFNKDLKRIGDIYEQGKDALNTWQFSGSEVEIHQKLHACLFELRNIACGQLQAIHGLHVDNN